MTDFIPFAPDRPCNWEKMSGVCMVCGAGPDDNCGYETDHPVIRAANAIIADQNRALARAHDVLAIIVANARMQPDASMNGSTDVYAVPLDDIDAANEVLARIRGAS